MTFPTSFSNRPLPALRELTITYASGCSTSSHPVPQCVLSSLEPVPSLERLNLQPLEVNCALRQLIGDIAEFAPALTHVRLPVVYGYGRLGGCATTTSTEPYRGSEQAS
jgi:hypothetical protein